jgi:hypothetical protein
MLSQIPPDQQPLMPATRFGESPEDSDPGSVVARALLTLPSTITIQQVENRPPD